MGKVYPVKVSIPFREDLYSDTPCATAFNKSSQNVSIPFREDLYSDKAALQLYYVAYGTPVSIPFREDLYSDL